ncbi:hypothetical protein [Streptomyces sp. NPDC058371]|uniref:hypothetical protein n=1 Tax=Streptomyces sp. NPDC058371 TaxID=3346463 RepID=UPI003668FEDC
MGEKSETAEKPKRKRVELSVPQVAGSAVAAVVAAKLASYFGVYGTILGAGVVSAIATCGGTVFQHFFRRTGEQIRDVTVPTRPKPLPESQVATPVNEFGAEFGEGFGAGTVYRARVRSWKRPVLAAALVFGVTMAGISTYELASGNSFSGGGSTTVGDALSGHNKAPSSGDAPSPDPSPTPSAGNGPTPSESDSPRSGDGGKAQSPTPTPGSTDSQGTDGASTPPPSPSVPTTPGPGASSRSQSADPGRVDPSGQ